MNTSLNNSADLGVTFTPHLRTDRQFDPRNFLPARAENGVFAYNKVIRDQIGLKVDQKGC